MLLRYDQDSFFNDAPAFIWVRPPDNGWGFYGGFTAYPDSQTAEVGAGGIYPLGPLSVAPGLGFTSGPGSWKLSTDTKRYLARDLVPQLTFAHSSEKLEFEGYNALWVPIQEDSSTAVWFAQNRWWIAAKRGTWGAGPHLETFFTQEGRKPFRLSHLWFGGHVLKNVGKASLQLFLGYDFVALDAYFGSRKAREGAYRATFIYPL